MSSEKSPPRNEPISHLEWLRSEVERLDTLLSVGSKAQKADLMEILTSSFPMQVGDEDAVRIQGRAYMIAIEEFPLSILNAVVTDILKGRVPDIDRRFVPTPAQMAHLCRERVVPLRAELHRRSEELRREETPQIGVRPELSEEERARVATKLQALSGALGASITMDRKGREEGRNNLRKTMAAIAQKKTGAEAPVSEGSGEEA
jgi:hypothetical protein